MICLRTFDQVGINDDGEEVQCEGWIFFSKAMFRNVDALLAAEVEGGLSIDLDATYKLLYNGWPLTACIGETIIESDNGKCI